MFVLQLRGAISFKIVNVVIKSVLNHEGSSGNHASERLSAANEPDAWSYPSSLIPLLDYEGSLRNHASERDTALLPKS